MEFTIACPNDGAVEVGLEDVASIVFDGFESVEVVFTCPHCGTEVRVSAKMPNLLITTLDLTGMLEETLGEDETVVALVETEILDDRDEAPAVPFEPDDDDGHIEHYCEYFRRQLSGVDTVEAFLQEVDAR